MAKRVADLLVDVLVKAGVQRIYGVPGDSLNGITDSIRTRDNIEWVGMRHEEAGHLQPERKRISPANWPYAPEAVGRETCT